MNIPSQSKLSWSLFEGVQTWPFNREANPKMFFFLVYLHHFDHFAIEIYGELGCIPILGSRPSTKNVFLSPERHRILQLQPEHQH